MPIDTTIIIYILGGIVLILILFVIKLGVRIRNLVKGKNGKSLEDSILSMQRDQEELKQFRYDMESYLGGVERRLRRSVQGVKTVRFNPFKGDGSGGNQSFATALLSERGDGVVISSIYARDRVIIFSKPVKNYVSEYEATDEEKRAIDTVKESLAGKDE